MSASQPCMYISKRTLQCLQHLPQCAHWEQSHQNGSNQPAALTSHAKPVLIASRAQPYHAGGRSDHIAHPLALVLPSLLQQLLTPEFLTSILCRGMTQTSAPMTARAAVKGTAEDRMLPSMLKFLRRHSMCVSLCVRRVFISNYRKIWACFPAETLVGSRSLQTLSASDLCLRLVPFLRITDGGLMCGQHCSPPCGNVHAASWSAFLSGSAGSTTTVCANACRL